MDPKSDRPANASIAATPNPTRLPPDPKNPRRQLTEEEMAKALANWMKQMLKG